MGWTGGAIGKNSNADVFELPPVIGTDNRAGLGFIQSVAFHQAVKNIITKFVQFGGHDDLVFSPTLTSEERGIVSTEARKNHLLFSCCREGPTVKDTYVVVSVQRSPMELVNFLQNSGGENHKYCLLEPCEVQS